MRIPGFSGQSSIFKSAVTYSSARAAGEGSGSRVHPAQGSSSCWLSCFWPCLSQCFAMPPWTFGSCFSACVTACNLQPCPHPTVCQNGSCVCAPPYTDCNGTCTSLLDDPNNCGSCGFQCPPWNFCEGGQCFPIT